MSSEKQLTLEQLQTMLESDAKVLKDHLDKTLADAQAKTLEQAEGKARDVATALKSEIDGITKTVGSIQDQIKVAQARLVPGLKEELKKTPFDFACAVQALWRTKNHVQDPWANAGPEHEMLKATIEQREKSGMLPESMRVRDVAGVNYAGDGTSGGYLIPDEVTTAFIDATIAQMPVMSLGPTVIRGLIGELPIPTKTQRSVGYMVGENEKPTASNVKYGEKVLRPHKAGVFSKQSQRLIYQSRGVSDKIIREDLQLQMALTMENQYINGTGTGKSVSGLAASGISAVSAEESGLGNGGRYRFDNAAAQLQALDEANEFIAGGRFGLLTHPTIKWGMKRERATFYSGQDAKTGYPVLVNQLLMSDASLSEQLGLGIGATTLVGKGTPAGTSYNATCAPVYVGNWSLFYIGMWRDMWLKVSDQASDGSTGSALLDDELYIVMFSEFDCAVMRQTAFNVVRNGDTNKANW